jgi:hypothetical protein
MVAGLHLPWRIPFMTSAEYVDCSHLPCGVRIDVETKNRHYLIECLGGSAIRISGHPEYCPVPVSGQLQGSSDKTGVLEPGLIGRGKYLRFSVDGQRPVTTSRVVSLHFDPREGPAPSMMSTVH